MHGILCKRVLNKLLMKPIFFVFFLLWVFSCGKEEDLVLEDGDYLVFGHYYGKCIGEQCVETFKLTESQLFEDSRDDFTGDSFTFNILLSEEKFRQVKDIKDLFPKALLQSVDTTFGCPNCADQGGLLVRVSEKGKLRTWRMDMDKAQLPDYLRVFAEEVRKKIEMLSE